MQLAQLRDENARCRETARQETIDARMALAAQARQTELLGEQLADIGAERNKLAQEKIALVQDNATLRERSLATGAKMRWGIGAGGLHRDYADAFETAYLTPD